MLYQFLLVLNDSEIQTSWNRNSGRDSSTTSNMYIHFLIKNPILISESLTFIQCIHLQHSILPYFASVEQAKSKSLWQIVQ